MTTLLWLRRDLRLDDQRTLAEAARDPRLLPVFCLAADPADGPGGLPRRGPHRDRFLRETLRALGDALRARGSDLLVVEAAPEQALPDLCRRFAVDRVVVGREPGSEESDQVARLATLLPCPLREIEEGGLLDAAALPFAVDALPDTFSAFRRQVERHARVEPPRPAPSRLPPVPAGARGTAVAPGPAGHDPRAVMVFRGGEAAGQRHLHTYLWRWRALRHYKATRNGLLRADDSSKLSPWLASGALSARRVYHETLRFEALHGGDDNTYWLRFELLWREYFRWVLYRHGGALFRRRGLRDQPPACRPDDARWRAWRDGRTGVPLIDAGLRELSATGFVSNRMRQNLASFLVHELAQDWRLGAAWFEACLIDYDPASNWGNWAYLAGVGNDPRGHRWFNVLSQAERYDPHGDYVARWLPERAALPADRRHRPERPLVAPWTRP